MTPPTNQNQSSNQPDASRRQCRSKRNNTPRGSRVAVSSRSSNMDLRRSTQSESESLNSTNSLTSSSAGFNDFSVRSIMRLPASLEAVCVRNQQLARFTCSLPQQNVSFQGFPANLQPPGISCGSVHIPPLNFHPQFVNINSNYISTGISCYQLAGRSNNNPVQLQGPLATTASNSQPTAAYVGQAQRPRRAGHKRQNHHSNPRTVSRRTRPTFDSRQVEVLENAFRTNKYLQGHERALLALKLRMTEKQIKIWFQNRRSKQRKFSNDDNKDN